MPEITVIICTYNREDRLRACIDSLLEQTCPQDRFDILVVDNNSTDGTHAYVRELASAHPNIRYVKETNQGLSHARNRGAREAETEWLAYLDDDAKAAAGYVENALAIIRDKQPDILGGPILPYYTSPKPGWFKDEYEIRRYTTESKFSDACRISGSNFVLPKRLLEQLGGFDTGLGMKGETQAFGEDADLLERYRAATEKDRQRVYYALECNVYHHVPAYKMRIPYMLGRNFGIGRMANALHGTPVGAGLVLPTLALPLLIAGYFLAAWELQQFRRFDPIIPLNRSAKLLGRVYEGYVRLVRKNAED